MFEILNLGSNFTPTQHDRFSMRNGRVVWVGY